MEILEFADEAFETTATLGMNKINRKALKTAAGATALAQAYRLTTKAKVKNLPITDMFLPPQTIRYKAGRAVGSPLADSIGSQIKLRNAKSIDEVKEIQKEVVPDSVSHRVATKVIETENLNAKYIDGLFDDAGKAATKDVTDDTLRQAIFFRQKIGRMVSDKNIIQMSNNIWEESFKNNVVFRSLLGDDLVLSRNKKDWLRGKIAEAERMGAVDNFVDDIVLREARANPKKIEQAAADVIADMVAERLFSRAPNNAVFFTRSLLIDKRIASNPEFRNKVRTELKQYPVTISGKGNISFERLH